jgi:hypothetical protein
MVKRGDSSMILDDATYMQVESPSTLVYKREGSSSRKLIDFSHFPVKLLSLPPVLPDITQRSSTFIGCGIGSAIHHADALALLRPRPFLARLTFSATHDQSTSGSCDTSRLNFSRVSPCGFFLLITL